MPKTFGERMKERRKSLKISVDEVAKVLGVSRATVYRYENGDIEKIPSKYLEPIAHALETNAAHLMGWDEETEKEETKRTGDTYSPNVRALVGIARFIVLGTAEKALEEARECFKISNNDKVCANCRNFHQHYVITASGVFSPISRGHCCPRGREFKHPNWKDSCDLFEAMNGST